MPWSSITYFVVLFGYRELIVFHLIFLLTIFDAKFYSKINKYIKYKKCQKFVELLYYVGCFGFYTVEGIKYN